MSSTRRELLRAGMVLTMGGALGVLDAREARASGHPLTVLTSAEGQTLEALGDTLLPGAGDAGIAHYVDAQLASDAPLLMLRYLDFPMPLLDFYRTGLAGLEALAMARHAQSFHTCSPEQRTELVRAIAGAIPDGWNGPPAPLFYFATRADAVDVVYGTQRGFAALAIPYNAHIAPTKDW